jgi:hypothetical protein
MALTGHDERRRTAQRRVVLIAVGGTAVLAAGVTALAVSAGSGSDSTDAAERGVPSTHVTTGPAATHPADGPLVLPKARSVRNGMPTGYPHTEDGAISAAAHYTDALDVFSPAVAEQQTRTIAEPGYANALGSYASNTARAARASAGLPLNGESGTSTYSVNQTRARIVASSSPDKVTVWLLVDVSSAIRGVTQTDTQVDGAVMVWKDGDWRLGLDTILTLPNNRPTAAVPDSPAASAEGWRSVAYQR